MHLGNRRGIRFVEYCAAHFVLVGGDALTQGRVVAGADAQGEQGGVFCAVQRYGGDRYARRHLQDGEDAVPAVDGVAGMYRHADDRQRGDGGDHAGQVCRAARTGDDDVESALGGGFAVVEQAFRGAVCRDDGEFVGGMELFAGAGSVLHDAKIAVAAHDDADFVHVGSLWDGYGRFK